MRIRPFDEMRLLCRDKWRVNGVDISKHFSYYALEGGTGQARWKHEVCHALQILTVMNALMMLTPPWTLLFTSKARISYYNHTLRKLLQARLIGSQLVLQYPRVP